MEGYALNKPLVSIIMPVYNVEKYLAQAINSVLNQTHTNFELILVDDASPDNSPTLCDEFSKKDSRICVIHKPVNQGLGYARNTGLDAAQGEYVYFIDSDDYIQNDLLEKALSAFTDNIDFVVFGINRFHVSNSGETTKIEKLFSNSFSAYTSDEIVEAFLLLNRNKIFPFAWNKLYKKSFIDALNIKFEKTKLIEDFLFNIHLFQNAKGIKIIPDCLYNYRKPTHETLASTYSPDFFDLCKRKYSLEKYFLDKSQANAGAYNTIYDSYIKHIISVFIKNHSKKSGLSYKQKRKEIKLVLNDEITLDVFNRYKPVSLVMMVILILLKTKSTRLIQFIISIISKIM